MAKEQFDTQNIDMIVKEVKESDKCNNAIEKAYCAYLKLGKRYKYRSDFLL